MQRGPYRRYNDEARREKISRPTEKNVKTQKTQNTVNQLRQKNEHTYTRYNIYLYVGVDGPY